MEDGPNPFRRMLPALSRHHSKTIQAISFDVGGTLIEPWPSVGHIYSRVAEDSGFQGISPLILDEQFAAAWKNRPRQDFQYRRADWREIVVQTFNGLCPRSECESFFPAIYDRFSLPSSWRIYPDVIPTLKALTQMGVRLAATSNWDERLRPLLDRMKLSDYFDSFVISCDVGTAKPDRGIYEQLWRELSLPPQNILHIGDSRHEDLEGARAAGMQACLIDRNAESDGPDHIVTLKRLVA